MQRGQCLLVLSHDRGWEVPGGAVEDGEHLIDALRREVMEETGVTIVNERLCGVYTNHSPPNRLLLWFVADLQSGVPRVSNETKEVIWVDPVDVLPKISNRSVYLRIKDALEFSGSLVYRAFQADTLTEADTQYRTLFETRI